MSTTNKTIDPQEIRVEVEKWLKDKYGLELVKGDTHLPRTCSLSNSIRPAVDRGDFDFMGERPKYIKSQYDGIRFYASIDDLHNDTPLYTMEIQEESSLRKFMEFFDLEVYQDLIKA